MLQGPGDTQQRVLGHRQKAGRKYDAGERHRIGVTSQHQHDRGSQCDPVYREKPRKALPSIAAYCLGPADVPLMDMQDDEARQNEEQIDPCVSRLHPFDDSRCIDGLSKVPGGMIGDYRKGGDTAQGLNAHQPWRARTAHASALSLRQATAIRPAPEQPINSLNCLDPAMTIVIYFLRNR